jgi:integrase
MKRENVGLINGTLTVLQSKGQKDRLVHLPPDGLKMLTEYFYNLESKLPNSIWLFPGRIPGKHITASTVQRVFKNCRNRLPFAENIDKQPSVHCLRHSFVVERINDWMNRGIDLQKMLSYLSTYLGHASPVGTFYYYHLVNEAFDIIKQKDKVSGRVIPEVMPYEEN